MMSQRQGGPGVEAPGAASPRLTVGTPPPPRHPTGRSDKGPGPDRRPPPPQLPAPAPAAAGAGGVAGMRRVPAPTGSRAGGGEGPRPRPSAAPVRRPPRGGVGTGTPGRAARLTARGTGPPRRPRGGEGGGVLGGGRRGR